MEDVVKLLFKRGGDLNAHDSRNKQTPLMIALRSSEDGSMVRILVNAAASVHLRASLGEPTPLILAATSGNATNARLLLERGASVHDVDADGKTTLLYAAEHLNPDALAKRRLAHRCAVELK